MGVKLGPKPYGTGCILRVFKIRMTKGIFGIRDGNKEE
jgi:hypothetical protein